MGRRVLITGVSSYLGTALARRLVADPAVEYVSGLDTRPPRQKVPGLDYIEADVRNPLIAKLIPQTEVDTVVHNQIVRRPGPRMSARVMHDINVIGSLQLLAACEKAPTVKAIVIRGSAGIYGSEPAAPQFFTEEMSRLYPLRSRFQRDVGEIENYFETFSRRHPEVVCMMLRYQTTIGASVDTQITRYLSLPVCPTYLGFDPRMQFIHEADAVDSLVASIARPVRGAVNVAGPGTVGLTKILRMAGKLSVPVPAPAFPGAVAVGRRFGLFAVSPDFRRMLQFGRGVEVRRLREDVGFEPRYTTLGALEDYVRTMGARRVVPSPLRAVTRR